jgi:phosphoribosylglycinamide formyltransferase-1
MDVVLLAGRGDSTWHVCNALHRRLGVGAVILERPVSKTRLLRARAHKLGWTSALGQAAFILASGILCWESRKRSAEISRLYNLSARPVAGVEIIEVSSVNALETISILRRLQPRVVVVNGTRIISQRILTAIEAVFINMHAGITPKYRGVHGGYWAFYNGDGGNAGVTVHLVDAGVDTVKILYQGRIDPDPRDNFCTYPLLQTAVGIPLLVRAIEDGLARRLTEIDGVHPSHQYFHPTLMQYLLARKRRNVK